MEKILEIIGILIIIALGIITVLHISRIYDKVKNSHKRQKTYFKVGEDLIFNNTTKSDYMLLYDGNDWTVVEIDTLKN
jgi:hypothetical protein